MGTELVETIVGYPYSHDKTWLIYRNITGKVQPVKQLLVAKLSRHRLPNSPCRGYATREENTVHTLHADLAAGTTADGIDLKPNW